MSKINKAILVDLWKQMWFAALLLYLSYFLYRWIGVYISKILGQVSDKVLYQNADMSGNSLMIKLLIAFLFSLILMPLIDLITNVFTFRKGLHYEAFVIDRVFKKDYESIQIWQSNEWSGRISRDPLQYRQMAVIIPARLFADITVLAVAVINLLQTSVLLTIILLIGVIISVAVQVSLSEKNNQFREGIRKYQDNVRVHQIEMARLHSFWVLYRCQKSLPTKMKSIFDVFYNNIKKDEVKLFAGLELFQKGTMLTFFMTSLYYGLIQVERGFMTAGNFITIYFLVIQVRTMSESVLTNLQTLRGYGAQEKRIKELIQGEEINGNKDVNRWNALHFENVSYYYPGTQKGMYERNFWVKHEELAVVEGHNGSGKTTLLKLLCGIFNSKNQQIKLDKRCLAEINLTRWRDKIGYMQQFPDIFPGTIRENVHIGNLNASQESLDFVLKKVRLFEMSERYLNGKKDELSGGEIKRIELARMLLRMEQCEVLMLDEPFENLDIYGKELVQEILNCSNKCRILITHTIKHGNI